MRNISDKSFKEIQNTHYIFNIFFFENSAFYEMKWKNIVEPDRPYMYLACALHARYKRLQTHTQNV